MVVMEAAVVTELEISTASAASVTASEPKPWVMHVLVVVLEVESMIPLMYHYAVAMSK